MLTPHQPQPTPALRNPNDLSGYTIQQLLTRFTAAMELFQRETAPHADRKLAGEAVVVTLQELRSRGYKISRHSSNFTHLFPADKVEMERPFGAVEAITSHQLQEHIYFYLMKQYNLYLKQGHKALMDHYQRGMMKLNEVWQVRAVHSATMKLEF